MKYCFGEKYKKHMTYGSFRFPEKYNDNKIYLKNMIEEKDAVKFLLIMMCQILDTQVESVGENA